MGWKKIRDHYDIKHMVHVRGGTLCIGSAYISEIIVVKPDGSFGPGETTSRHADLLRYERDIAADRETFARLFAEPDVFEKSIPVYRFEGGTIVEEFCEEVGWPNITHGGTLMYDNHYWTDPKKAVKAGIKDADIGAKYAAERLLKLQKEIVEEAANLEKCRADAQALRKLQAIS